MKVRLSERRGSRCDFCCYMLRTQCYFGVPYFLHFKLQICCGRPEFFFFFSSSMILMLWNVYPNPLSHTDSLGFGTFSKVRKKYGKCPQDSYNWRIFFTIAFSPIVNIWNWCCSMILNLLIFIFVLIFLYLADIFASYMTFSVATRSLSFHMSGSSVWWRKVANACTVLTV